MRKSYSGVGGGGWRGMGNATGIVLSDCASYSLSFSVGCMWNVMARELQSSRDRRGRS